MNFTRYILAHTGCPKKNRPTYPKMSIETGRAASWRNVPSHNPTTKSCEDGRVYKIFLAFLKLGGKLNKR